MLQTKPLLPKVTHEADLKEVQPLPGPILRPTLGIELVEAMAIPCALVLDESITPGSSGEPETTDI